MLEILQFIFSGFWIWLGTVGLMFMVVAALSEFRLFEIRTESAGAWKRIEKILRIKTQSKTDVEALGEALERIIDAQNRRTDDK